MTARETGANGGCSMRPGGGWMPGSSGVSMPPLSSPGEVDYAVTSPKPRRVLFDLRRIMRSRYRIDAYQETYFVIDSFQQLFDATAPDFTPLYRELGALPDLAADAALPQDRLAS